MIAIILFTLGLCVGSFLNVLIDRLPRGENPWIGRSHCDYCKKTLRVRNLIPILSFVIAGGKSTCCHKKLSFQYPLVEAATGILLVLVYWYQPVTLSPLPHWQTTVSFLSLNVVVISFLVIFMTDMKYQIIPDEMAVIVALASLSFILLTGQPLVNHILAGVGAFLALFSIYVFSKGKAMGFGDVKLVFVLGLFLGYPLAFIGLYLAFLTGAAVSLILIITHKKKFKQRIAFGPFLIIGAVIAFFYGHQLAQWYLHLIT